MHEHQHASKGLQVQVLQTELSCTLAAQEMVLNKGKVAAHGCRWAEHGSTYISGLLFSMVTSSANRRTRLLEGSAEANERSHYAPKEAAKGNYMCSVILVTKHATDWRCCSLHMQ